MLQQEVFAKRLRGRDVVSVENLITVLPGYVYWGMQGKGGGEAEDTAKVSVKGNGHERFTEPNGD